MNKVVYNEKSHLPVLFKIKYNQSFLFLQVLLLKVMDR